MPTLNCPPCKILLSLPGSALPTISLSGFNGTSEVVTRSTVNLKASRGYTVGGGLKVLSSGAFKSKSIWRVKALVLDEGVAAQYRDMVYAQQVVPFLGQVVLTDLSDPVNAFEAAWGTRTTVVDAGYSNYVAGGITRYEIAARVFLEPDDDMDIIRSVGKGGWAIEFTATEL